MASAAVVNVQASSGSRPRPQEIALGYLFIAPALIITFIFGLFPVILGFVISMQDGTLIPNGFVGFRNYFAALGSIAYLLAIALALVLTIAAYYAFRVPYRAMHEGKGTFYPYLLPGTLAALGTMLLLGIVFGDLLEFVLLPVGLLVVAVGAYIFLQRQQPCPISYAVNAWLTMLLTFSAVFLLLLIFHELDTISTPYLEALSQAVSFNKYIMPLNQQFIALFIATLSAGTTAFLFGARRKIDSDKEPRRALLLDVLRFGTLIVTIGALIYIFAGQALLQGTLSALKPDRLAAVTSLKPAAFINQVMVWPEVFTTMLGASFIGLAFLLWTDALRRQTTPGIDRKSVV